jgi:hypothetical protein
MLNGGFRVRAARRRGKAKARVFTQPPHVHGAALRNSWGTRLGLRQRPDRANAHV